MLSFPDKRRCLLRVRYFKKEPKIITEHTYKEFSETVDALGFAPIGRDEPYRVFISEDPIGLAGGINKYAMALNNPVNLTDPTGNVVGVAAALPVPWWGPLLPAIPIILGTPSTIADEPPVPSYQESRGHSDPVGNYVPVNPGRSASGQCNPCPPDSPVWEHEHCDGTTNRHQIIWNQDPNTCMCFPKRIHL
jgi:hypothetical protein